MIRRGMGNQSELERIDMNKNETMNKNESSGTVWGNKE